MLRSTIKRIILIFMVLTLTIILAVPQVIAMEKVEIIETNLLKGTVDDTEKIHFIKHADSSGNQTISNGDSILIESNNHFGLVDMGKEGSRANLNKYLKAVLGNNKLDFILFTHVHSDHMGGIEGVTEFVDGNTIVFYKQYEYIVKEESLGWNNIGYFNKAIRLLRAKTSKLCEVSTHNWGNVSNSGVTGITYHNGSTSGTNVDDNIKFTFGDFNVTMYNIHHISDDEDNCNSIVTLLERTKDNKKIRVLLTGDQETRIRPDTGNSTEGVENQIAKIVGQVTLLKAGHHGNQSSNSLVMLSELRPHYTVVTATWKNGLRESFKYAVRYLNKINTAKDGTCNNEVYVTGNSKGAIVAVLGDGEINFVDYTYNYKDGTMATNIAGMDYSGWAYINRNSNEDIVYDYVDSKGNMKTGWMSKGGKWYYLCQADNEFTGYQKGQMVTGWKVIKSSGNNYWFYFAEDGTKYDEYGPDGEVSVNHNLGEMMTGRRQVVYNGRSDYYYFCETTGTPTGYVKGAMVKSATIDGYTYDANGRCTDKDEKAPSVVSVKYSTKKPTKVGVKVKVVVDEEIAPIEGWTLEPDKRTLTKIFTESGSETITINDLANPSNTSTKTITINNIDKTPPRGEATYSTEELTNEDVTVTITSNEKIGNTTTLGKNGWEISPDQKTITKVFGNNIKGTRTISDEAGNTYAVPVEIKNIDKEGPTITINYSNTELTNEDVYVTIEANEPIKLPSSGGWERVDSNSIRKKYEQNVPEASRNIYDLAGNPSRATVSIFNIDKDPPVLDVTYSTENPTNQNVIVTVTETENQELQLTEDMVKKRMV